METPTEWVDIGAWVGRQQAFAVIATKCSSAQAQSLKQVKESRSFEKLGLTWKDFCTQYAGISRVHADRVIQQYQEFGEAYFRLSEIARISPETYRQIAPQLSGDVIEIDGEQLALTSENAPKIRAAIQTLRAKLRAANQRTEPPLGELRVRLDALLDDAWRFTQPGTPTITRGALQELAAYAIGKWTRLARTLQSQP